jgi:hypothetical protein
MYRFDHGWRRIQLPNVFPVCGLPNSRSHVPLSDAPKDHLLPRCNFFLVSLVRTNLGVTEEPIWRGDRISVESRAHGFLRHAEVSTTTRMVLSTKRNHCRSEPHNPVWLVRSSTRRLEEYLAPNLVAEAAIDFGIGWNDDRVRLAIAEAGLLDGRPTSQLAEAIAAAVAAVPELDDKSLNDRASSAEIEQRIRATTAEFHALQAPQRPTYVLENEIGDRVVFSGIVRPDPLIATIGAMLADAKAQQDYDKSHEPMPR